MSKQLYITVFRHMNGMCSTISTITYKIYLKFDFEKNQNNLNKN